MKTTSIQTKLLLILLPFFIICFGILSGVSYYLASQSLSKSVDETAMVIGADYANQIQADLREKMVQLEDLASVQSVRTGSDKALIADIMAETQQRIGVFDVIFFISPDASGIRSNKAVAQYHDRDYFKKVLETKKAYISEPIISKTTGKLSVMLAVPVFNNGQLTGVLGGTYSLEKLSELVKGLKFKDTGHGYIADNSGVVIAHPNPEIVGKLKLSEKKIQPELKLSQTELDDRLMNLFKTAAEGGKQVEGKYNAVDGDTCIAVFTPIKLPGGKDWVIVVAAPEAEVTRETATLARMMLILSLVFIVVAILFIVILSKRFTRMIQVIRDECMLLTQGDLREREAKVVSQDEIGQLAKGIREMKSNLSALVTKIKLQSDQVAASSEQLTASAQECAEAANQVACSITEIAQGTEKQAASATRISAVAEQMLANTEHISATASAVSELAGNTSQEAEQGRQTVEQAIDQMKQIETGSEAVQIAIAELAQGSREISEIVNLISAIAGQTNLLALNAAIEAARAGEHGRGFAVVAEEVRKLAEDSNQAAQQIGELIQENQANMDQAVAATQAGVKGIKAGIEVVNSAGETFKKIVGAIMQLSEQIKQISQSINQMAAGSRTMVSSIHEIDKISKENAAESQTVSAATEEQSASMQEIAAASQSLANLAGELQEAVAKFQV